MFGSGMEDEPPQAVIVADNFNDNFSPALSDIPLALLPVAGVPLVDYALESLARSGVNETFLFCSSRADRIKAHVRCAREKKAAWSASMAVQIIVSENCQSFGDALRDLDAKGFINGHFILAGVDTVSNVKLLPLIEKHKETCKKDKGAAMTLLFKTASPDHRSQRSGDAVLLAADANTGRVLFHRKLPKGQSKINFPIEVFLDHADVEIHHDLLDAHIAICSPSVLPLFADNFDFQTRDDFVKGILMNEEILSSTIYWHQLQGDQYAAKVSNWQMYQIISQDIMHRWVFPLVPDMEISKEQNKYTLLKNHVYQHNDVTLAKICYLDEFVIISTGSSVGEHTKIARSVIGKNCTIGANCKITDSYIMDNCIVSDNCTITATILSSNCKIGKKVETNSIILGPDVKLGDGVKLKECLVQKEPASASSQKIGNSAYIFDTQLSNENDSIESVASDDNAAEVSLPVICGKWEEEESENYSSSSEDEMSRSVSPVQEDANLFLHEVIDSLARGYDEKLKCDYLILEINSSRYAYNMSLQEVNFYVTQALFNLPPMSSTSNIVATFKDLFKYFTPIISNYIKGSAAMIDCLNAIEDCCEKNDALSARVAQVIHLLYENDVITEDAVIEWFSKVSQEKRSLSKNSGLKKFIDWLEEASEESNDD